MTVVERSRESVDLGRVEQERRHEHPTHGCHGSHRRRAGSQVPSATSPTSHGSAKETTSRITTDRSFGTSRERPVEQGRIRELDRRWRDRVADVDVDLQHHLRGRDDRGDSDAHARVRPAT